MLPTSYIRSNWYFFKQKNTLFQLYWPLTPYFVKLRQPSRQWERVREWESQRMWERHIAPISKASLFLFPEQLHLTPPTSAEREEEYVLCPHWNSEEIKPHTHAHTERGDTQRCFQHLLSKALGVIALKKTCGWNLTLLLALCRLKQSSCHCDCHYCCVSNGGAANVSRPLGTSESPPALSDWGAIYLSASTSTLSLLNPSIRQGPRAPMENTRSHIAPKSIKRMAVKGTWIAEGQAYALKICNHLVTAADRNENWWTVTIMEWEFLYWLSDHVIVRSERQQKNKYGCIHAWVCTHARTHNTINCTTTATNSNYRGCSEIMHPKQCMSVWVMKTSLYNSPQHGHLLVPKANSCHTGLNAS